MDAELRLCLDDIIREQRLTAVFQPVVDMKGGEILGFEGLIRGPADCPLHSPLKLFHTAQNAGRLAEIEYLSRLIVLQHFVRLALPGKLFLNVSPKCLLLHTHRSGATLDFVSEVGLNPNRVIIELTENEPTFDYGLLREAVEHYRSMGFQVAIDDLGEGFSSLRLWSELRPDYVKIDMHFVQGINRDPVKLQFVRSIQQIAENSGCQVIAEGIETQAELLIIKDLGIALGQGYHFARPAAQPARVISAEAAKTLAQHAVPLYPQSRLYSRNVATALKILRAVEAVEPETDNESIYERFHREPNLQVVAVVKDGIPVGIIPRSSLIDRFARPYSRELYGRKPCSKFMDTSPVVVDSGISLQELSHIMVEAEHHHLANGFIITEQGKYLGLGTGQDLMREITEMQIAAARYANPLTLLPGNVPINEHTERLLSNRVPFVVCYCDLDHFKPFNDVYGYRKGDEVIQLSGRILASVCDPERDFIGHVGGDDFIVLFQSPDWELRCRSALAAFDEGIRNFFSLEDRESDGYIAEDRQGRKVFHPLTSLSLGVVTVEPGSFPSHQAIAAAAAEAKKQAKKITGHSLFVERRKA